MVRWLGVLMVALGCATTGDLVRSDLRIGMSRAEVVRLLGQPDGVKVDGEFEALSYANRPMHWNAAERADYSVILRAGRVVEYGVGQVRSPRVGMMVLVP